MNLQAILVANGFGIVLMIMLLTSGKESIRHDDLSDQLSYLLIWATILLCSLESAAFAMDGHMFPFARALNMTINTMIFSINIIFVYIWVIYIDYKIFQDLKRLRQREFILAIPMIFVLIMLLINLFTPVLFKISDHNVYSRTSLTFIPFVISFGYLILSEVYIYTQRNNTKRYLFLPTIIFVTPLVVVALLQMFIYGISLSWAALSISVVSLFMNIQNEFNAIDSLSGVYSRQYLTNYLWNKKTQQKYLIGIMIDANHFKEINDTYGHQMGDQAIASLGHLLHHGAGVHDIVSRYGGDEFIIVHESQDLNDATQLIDAMEEQIRQFNEERLYPFHLSLSYGVSVYRPHENTIDDFLKEMDNQMYDNKRAGNQKKE